MRPHRYVSAGLSSVVNYTPATDLDYGTLLCSAKNSIGWQSVPCVFHIVPAGGCDIQLKGKMPKLGN